MCGGLQHDAPSLARPQQKVSQSCCRPSGLFYVANMIGAEAFASSMSLLKEPQRRTLNIGDNRVGVNMHNMFAFGTAKH